MIYFKKVIFHPDYIDNTKLQYKKSLIELEFNVKNKFFYC